MVRMPSWTEGFRIRFEAHSGKSGLWILYSYYRWLTWVPSAFRAVRKRRRIKFIDVGEQFAEGACAVIDQALALFRRGRCCVPCGPAWVKVLGLPRERSRPMRGKPAIVLFHGDAAGTKIRDLFLAHGFRIARQHDRGFDRAAMDTMTQFFI